MKKYVIAIWLAAACGGSSSKGTVAPATEPAGDCTSQLEDAQPGNHDRFSFSPDDGATYGYKNGAGEVVIAPRFGFAYEFGAGGVAAAVERPEDEAGQARFWFIDPSGKPLAEAYAFDNGPDYFQEGMARIVDGGKVGFIDRTGAIVIAPQFVEARSFCHGQASVHDGTDEWEIDRSGKAVSARRPHTADSDPCGDD